MASTMGEQLWDGHLRNSAGDIVIDCLLLLAIIYSYLPQIGGLLNRQHTSGLSPSYVLFNALFSTSQLSMMLLDAAYAWPSLRRPVLEMIGDCRPDTDTNYSFCEGVRLYGWEAFGGILGLLQIAVQWACSVIFLFIFVRYSKSRASRITLPILAILYFLVIVVPIMCFALPHPSHPEGWDNLGMAMIVTPIMFANLVLTPTFLVLQVVAQVRELRRQKGNPGALSLSSLKIQALVMAAVAWRWNLRVQTAPQEPGTLYMTVFLWLYWWSADWTFEIAMTTWGTCSVYALYAWHMPVVNYTVLAIGSATLLTTYHFVEGAGRDIGEQGERAPLLGRSRDLEEGV